MNSFASITARLVLTLGLAAGASTAITTAQQPPAVEQGVPGTVAPQSADVRLPDTLVNQDTTGGTNQVLISIAASPGAGFATVWRDQRDGMLGLYLARTNASGELLEPERPIHQPHSGRRNEPAVALGKDNSGAVVWVGASGRGTAPWVRTFDAEGKWLSTDRLMVPADEEPRSGREPSRLPVVAALPQGGYAVAWTHIGQVKYQEIDRDGAPRGKLVRLAPSSPAAEAGVHLAVGNRGSVLCVWRTEEGNLAVNHSRSDTAPVNCGMGFLCRLIADPVGGFWGAFLVDGRPDRPEVKPISTECRDLDLALGDDFIALLAEPGKGPRAEPRAAPRGEKKKPGPGAGRTGGRSADAKERGASGSLVVRAQRNDAGFAANESSAMRIDEPREASSPSIATCAARTARNGELHSSSAAASGELLDTSASPIDEPRDTIAMLADERSDASSVSPSRRQDASASTTGEQRDGNAAPAREQTGTGTAQDDPRGTNGRASDGRPAGDGSASSFTVYLLDREGRENESSVPIRVPSDAAVAVRGPRLASNGKRVLIAWTDQRNGDQDVYGRVLEPAAPRSPGAAGTDPRLGPELRLNSDFASSDQNNPHIASSGPFALIAWQDARDNINRVFARRLGPDGFTSDEFSIPAKFGDAPVPEKRQARIQPSVAIQSNGDFAVQWKEPRGEQGYFRVQFFGADGRALGAPLRVDETQDSVSDVILALGPERGYVVAWIRSNRGGLWVRRLSSDGKFGTAVRIADAQDVELGDLAGAVLDDGRTILVWDAHGNPESLTLRARFLDAASVPAGDEITIEPSPRKSDWQPCVAPAANNGFVLGWTSGSPNDPGHDVVARVFGARGEPAGPLLPISTLAQEQDYSEIVRMPDKSYVIAWEDDISFYDHTYLRRILPSGRELGTIVRMNELETKSVEDRTGPVLAVVGDGIAGAWNDRRRSQGWDVYMRIMGPKFDDVRKR
jgi:hypothetical protein